MIIMNLQMTIFPTPTVEGRELLDAILPVVRAYGFRAEPIFSPTQKDVFRACTYDDAVILDATVESDGSHNYSAFTAQPMAMDHILVLSRTYLPMNFHGLREGGAPIYPKSFSNQTIVSWLKQELVDMQSLLPRSRWQKNFFGSIAAQFKSLNKAAAREQAKYQVFISYRNRDFTKVTLLKDKIKKGEFHDQNIQGVRIFEPGELTFQDEVLSAMQRWHIMSIIEERLRHCREMWIYETPRYYDSWWTRGEVILLSYFQAVSGHRPVLKVFKLDEREVLSEPPGLIPEMRYEQKRKLDRLLSTSGRTMGAETSRRMRELSEKPFLRDLSFFNDTVYSLDFLNNRLLEHQQSRGNENKVLLNIDDFLRMTEPLLIPIPESILNDAEKNGSAIFGEYEIRLEPKPRYIWYATRMGRLTGPEKTNEMTIARQQVYRAFHHIA